MLQQQYDKRFVNAKRFTNFSRYLVNLCYKLPLVCQWWPHTIKHRISTDIYEDTMDWNLGVLIKELASFFGKQTDSPLIQSLVKDPVLHHLYFGGQQCQVVHDSIKHYATACIDMSKYVYVLSSWEAQDNRATQMANHCSKLTCNLQSPLSAQYGSPNRVLTSSNSDTMLFV